MRPSSPYLDALIGQRIPVLDEHGYIMVVDYMGDDSSVAQAARVSYNRHGQDADPKKDLALLRYLLRAKHTSPFEVCELRLIVSAPIFVARQWIRHRTANVNEVSARYTVLPDVRYRPGLGRLVRQSKSNKQGSSTEPLSPSQAAIVLRGLDTANRAAQRAYQVALGTGLAKEMARIVLPLSTYTLFSFKMDLHNLLHFLRLRLDPHAQHEIRVYAEAIYELVKGWVPATAQAFEDYALGAQSLSAQESFVVSALLRGEAISPEHRPTVSRREFIEFCERFGLKPENMRSNFNLPESE